MASVQCDYDSSVTDGTPIQDNMGDVNSRDVNTDDAPGKMSGNLLQRSKSRKVLIYGVSDRVPIALSLLLGLQQVILAIGGALAISFAIGDVICAKPDDVIRAKILSTTLFIGGVSTLLQTLFGVRLPIYQGPSPNYLVTLIAMRHSKAWICPPAEICLNTTHSGLICNETSMENRESTMYGMMRETQLSLILASLLQVLVGTTGIIGLLLRFIGPLTIAPTIALVGLSLGKIAIMQAEINWGIAILTAILIVIFSLYLSKISVPIPIMSAKGKINTVNIPVFTSFAILLAILIGWLLCFILTVTDVLSNDPDDVQYMARSDSKLGIMGLTQWFYVPHPGQYGTQFSFNIALFLGFFVGTIASILESLGDYFAAANVCQVQPPPAHAINRGIAIEGVGSIISGLIGAGHATTSFSENIASLAITKVANRQVYVAAGCILLLIGIIGKISGALILIPSPVIGGVELTTFGMIVAVGISALRNADLTTSRNLTIIGLSIFLGVTVPNWLEDNAGSIQTGSKQLDQILSILLASPMFLGGLTAFVLDNTVSGTQEERGLLKWRERSASETGDEYVQTGEHMIDSTVDMVYDLPFLTRKRLAKYPILTYIPFLPTYKASMDLPKHDLSANGSAQPDSNNIRSV